MPKTVNKSARQGQALVSMLIATPCFLFLSLGVFQFALLMNAHQAVKTAAHKALRSLIVNVNRAAWPATKRMMEEAAALSLAPASPRLTADHLLSSGRLPKTDASSALKGFALLSAFKKSSMSKKYLYARAMSDVRLIEPMNASRISRGTKVRIRVDYLFDLSVPIVGKVIKKLFEGKKSLLPLAKQLITISKSAAGQSEN